MKTGMCHHTSRQPPTDTQCIPMASSGHPRLRPVQSGQWPFPGTLQPRGHVGWVSSRQAGVQRLRARGSGGQTDSLGWTGPDGWHVAELLLSAPGSLAHLGVPSALRDVPPASASQGRAALSLGQVKEQRIFNRGKEPAVQLIQNNDILQNRHILHIL